eukprot:3995013-Amphidinium_carterae.1
MGCIHHLSGAYLYSAFLQQSQHFGIIIILARHTASKEESGSADANTCKPLFPHQYKGNSHQHTAKHK